MGRAVSMLMADASVVSTPASHALAIAIWIGLGILTVALFVLMRTRWGQAQPLSKCVVLSVFAHVLFFAYAYGTRLIFDSRPPRQEEHLRLSLISHDDRDVQEPTTRHDWDRLASEFTIAPNVASPAVQEIPGEAEMFEASTSPPEFAVGIDAAPPLESAESEPLPEPDISDAEALAATAPSPIEVDLPQHEPAVAEPTVMPDRNSPDRLPVDTAANPLKVSETSAPHTDANPSEDTLQRLVDVDLNAQAAEARPADNDYTDATTNQQDGPVIGSVGGSSATENAAATQPPATARPTRRLGDGRDLPEVYRARISQDKLGLVKQQGGTEQSEQAVQAALAWLAANQSADGRWDADRFGAGNEARVSGHDREGSGANADTGITGLALLAFLSAGHTHFEGDYRRTVQHGLEFLLAEQAANGSFAGNARIFARMYCHGMASLAVSEAYAMTGDHRMRPAVERAVQFTIAAQHPQTGGWRYQPADRNDLSHDRGDMSQFGWQVMSLKSAELAGVSIPAETRIGMLRFLRSVSKGPHGGLASYRPTERPSRTMTAEALACRTFLGLTTEQDTIREATAYLSGELPKTGKANLYYWYYATLALHQTQNKDWLGWNRALQTQLLERQRRAGPMAGSWDADTVWGAYGGRVYTTALAALCLEVYYRYLPVYE